MEICFFSPTIIKRLSDNIVLQSSGGEFQRACVVASQYWQSGHTSHNVNTTCSVLLQRNKSLCPHLYPTPIWFLSKRKGKHHKAFLFSIHEVGAGKDPNSHRGERSTSGGAALPQAPAEVGAIRGLARAPGCPWGFPGKPSGSRAAFLTLSINLYCAAGKPSLNPAVKDKSLFSLNIEHFHSLYLFSWITRQTFPAYEFPRPKSTCVWLLTPAPRPRPSGGAGARAAGISAHPGGERRGTRRDFGQPRTELDPAIHPCWGRSSQHSVFWGLSRISLRAWALLRGKPVAERVSRPHKPRGFRHRLAILGEDSWAAEAETWEEKTRVAVNHKLCGNRSRAEVSRRKNISEACCYLLLS